MKTLNAIIPLLLILIMVACSENQNKLATSKSINLEDPFKNDLQIIKNGSLSPISKSELIEKWKKDLNILSNIEFEKIIIVEGLDSIKNEPFLTLYGRSQDGKISVSHALIIQDGKLVLGKKSCKCETVSCSWSGCDAQQSGDRCSCSACSGDCKKTSTDSDEVIP